MKKIFLLTILIIGLTSACGTQLTASPPTDQPAPTTQIPVSTDTATPTEIIAPTETTQPITDTPAAQTATVSFSKDILPLTQNRCKNCHGGNKTEEDLNLLSYADIMKGSKNGPVVIPGDANNSLIVELLLNQKMPKRGPKLTPPQVQLFVDWINQGALDN